MLGSIVQKGKLADCALALDKQLNNVDFPTFGKPTIPHFKAITNIFFAKIISYLNIFEKILTIVISPTKRITFETQTN